MADEIVNEVELNEENDNEKKEATLDNLSEHDHKMIDHDMKYRGPLSYRGFRLIGWISLAFMFVSMILAFILQVKMTLTDISESTAISLSNATLYLSYFSALPLPMFLIANFAIILQSRNNYKKLIFTYLKILLIIYIAFIFGYYHYVVLLLMRLGGKSFVEARSISIEIFTALGKQNGLVVNVFVDLLCCALMMFFIDYTPKNHFQGKKIIIFRLLALLPFLYEVGSAVMMGLLGMNAIYEGFTFSLPPEVLPLIGKKPIGMILAFVVVCIFIKLRERVYLQRGGTLEGYALYVKTNRNSFRFSLFMAIIFLIIAVIDLLAVVIPVAIVSDSNIPAANNLLEVLESFTIGKSICLVLVIPFIMLFSYSKQHKNTTMDKLLPIIGIALVVFSIIETLFFGLLF